MYFAWMISQFYFCYGDKISWGERAYLSDNSRVHSHYFGDITGVRACTKYLRHFHSQEQQE